MKKDKLQMYFSQISGEIYSIEQDEIENVDEFQIPLNKAPNSNCKQCYGRGYIGRDAKTKHPTVCVKCISKCMNRELMDKQITRLRNKDGNNIAKLPKG